MSDYSQDIPKTHRMLDPHLGGGALLDLYVLTYANVALTYGTSDSGALIQ